jgi:hypothetical protein
MFGMMDKLEGFLDKLQETSEERLRAKRALTLELYEEKMKIKAKYQAQLHPFHHAPYPLPYGIGPNGMHAVLPQTGYSAMPVPPVQPAAPRRSFEDPNDVL